MRDSEIQKSWEIIPSPEIFISAAAQRTKRIRLGTGVVNLPYHHPFDVAERIAFLDHLTKGRLDFGVGPGILTTDVKLFGLDPKEVRPMMEESIEIITMLFKQKGPVTYEGKYWTIKERELMLKPYQEPHTPMAVASMGGPHGTSIAAKYGLQLLSGSFLTAMTSEQLRAQWESAEQQAKQHGTTMHRQDWRVVMYVYLAETKEQALKDIEMRMSREQLEYFQPLSAKIRGTPYNPHAKFDVPKMARERQYIVTDPAGCVEWLKDLERVTGGIGGLLIVSTDWTTRENWLKSMELFARYVMPEFKPWGRGPQQAWQRMMDWATK